MKTIIVAELAILLAASGCGNARGATPDAGTFAYSSRQQVKCNTVTMGPQDTEVHAPCTSSDDLPLAGSCSNPGPDLNVVLGVNTPLGWEIGGGIPTWGCSWVATGGGPAVHVQNATATICCVVKTQ